MSTRINKRLFAFFYAVTPIEQDDCRLKYEKYYVLLEESNI